MLSCYLGSAQDSSAADEDVRGQLAETAVALAANNLSVVADEVSIRQGRGCNLMSSVFGAEIPGCRGE